jgi:hypothetical protein
MFSAWKRNWGEAVRLRFILERGHEECRRELGAIGVFKGVETFSNGSPKHVGVDVVVVVAEYASTLPS